MDRLDYTDRELEEIFSDRYPETKVFTASQCDCFKTANVLVGPEWFCNCGNRIELPLNNTSVLWKSPDYGPSRERISNIIRKIKQRGVKSLRNPADLNCKDLKILEI